jgi:hypothetical protein
MMMMVMVMMMMMMMVVVMVMVMVMAMAMAMAIDPKCPQLEDLDAYVQINEWKGAVCTGGLTVYMHIPGTLAF